MKYLKYFENHLTKTVCHYGMKLSDNDLKNIFNTSQTVQKSIEKYDIFYPLIL
jgi:hypothetical protein